MLNVHVFLNGLGIEKKKHLKNILGESRWKKPSYDFPFWVDSSIPDDFCSFGLKVAYLCFRMHCVDKHTVNKSVPFYVWIHGVCNQSDTQIQNTIAQGNMDLDSDFDKA